MKVNEEDFFYFSVGVFMVSGVFSKGPWVFLRVSVLLRVIRSLDGYFKGSLWSF